MFKAKLGSVGRPPKQPINYAVTFESNALPPVTIRGTIQASNPARSVYLAVKDARSQAKGIRWSSLSVLLSKDGAVPV
jgi:hypothetical protein